MKLQQLRCIVEVARQDLNVTAAASALFTSQPGVSKQIRLLEEELGVELFERSGRQLVRVTEAGRTILQMAERMLLEGDNIRQAATEFRDETRGSLSIATEALELYENLILMPCYRWMPSCGKHVRTKMSSFGTTSVP